MLGLISRISVRTLRSSAHFSAVRQPMAPSVKVFAIASTAKSHRNYTTFDSKGQEERVRRLIRDIKANEDVMARIAFLRQTLKSQGWSDIAKKDFGPMDVIKFFRNKEVRNALEDLNVELSLAGIQLEPTDTDVLFELFKMGELVED